MNATRTAAFPAIIGGLLVLIGLMPALSGLQAGGSGELVSGVRIAAIPTGIGLALLLTALAIRRQTRLGFLLGIAAAVLMAVAGLGVIVIQIPYLDQGGLSAAFAGPFMAVAATWSLLWAIHGRGIYTARSAFSPTWEANDRRLAIVFAGLVVFSSGLFVSLGLIQDEALARDQVAQGEIQVLVAATVLEVRVLDATLGQDPDRADAGPVVERLRLELTVQSPRAYSLVVAPSMCLTDLATFQDPAFKPGTSCWGTPGQGLDLASDFADLVVPSDERTIRVELARTGSSCAFAPGRWNAALTLAPNLAGEAAAPELYMIEASFLVPGETGSVPRPSNGAVAEPTACIT